MRPSPTLITSKDMIINTLYHCFVGSLHPAVPSTKVASDHPPATSKSPWLMPLVMLLCGAANALAADYPFGEFTCRDVAPVAPSTVTTVTIVKYNGSAGWVEIPTTIDDKPVTNIGSVAFSGCASLMSVTIPVGVTNITGNAFLNCTSLTSVSIPGGVTNIGTAVFKGCTSLTSVTIPSGVPSIKDNTFSGCTSLTSVTIPNSVTSIGISAFSGCTSLASIRIPSSIINIRNSAFSSCSGLVGAYYMGDAPTMGTEVFQE